MEKFFAFVILLGISFLVWLGVIFFIVKLFYS